MRTREELEAANVKKVAQTSYMFGKPHTVVYETTYTGMGDQLLFEVLLDIRDLLTSERTNS